MKVNSTNVHFKKYFLILLLGLLLGSGKSVVAQIPASSYSFTALTGTYADITGGTAITGLLADDNLSSVQDIRFTFNYCGINYTQLKLCSNGWATFNTGVTSTTWTNSTANLNIIKPALMPLFDDLAGWGSGAAVNSAVTGTAPNRIYTVEFKNWSWRGTSGGTPHLSFQIKLYETTNVVEYIYKQLTATPNAGGATIGIGDGQATPTYIVLNNSSATPTASSTTFTTNITARPATDQIYRFTPPPSCSVTPGLPTAGTCEASPATLCLQGNVTLTTTPATAMPIASDITYQWQTSPTPTGTFTNIPGAITTLPSYTTTTPITASAYFRAVALCNGTSTIYTSSASNQVVVNNPGDPTGVPGSRCGPGSVALSATPPASTPGAVLNWYTTASGGAPVQTGANYNTPYITNTTNFYVAALASSGGAPQTLSTTTVAGNGCGGGVMFDIDPNVAINIDSFRALALSSGTNQTVTIYMKTGSYLGSETNPAAWTTVATLTNVTTTANQMVTFPLPTPLVINGNVLTGIYINYDAVYSTIPAGTLYSNADMDIIVGAGLCNLFGSVNAGRAFNGTVCYRTIGCEGSRVPVTATVNPSTPVARTSPAVVCNNAVASITLTPPTPAYPSYNWSPSTNLYTDAAATIPYTGGSATTVYLKTTNVGTQSVYMMAGDPTLTTGCTYADTVKIWVQPNNVSIKGEPDTICLSGSSNLKLDTIGGYYAGSIQWQTSANGTTYTDITGATNPTYATPTLAYGQNTYYKAIIKADTAVCQSPTKYVVIANPTLISAPDSFNCGPGTVTLTAVTGGNGTPVWYSSAAGGPPIGSGSPFVTPYLGTTTSFYVASRGGGTSGVATVGTGSSNSTSNNVTPFAGGWGGTKTQYLIKAAELLALGIPVNANLTSLAIDAVTVGNNYPGFAISMKNANLNALTTTYEGGLTEVMTPTNVTVSAGINTFNFTTPFVWTGGDLVVQVCWSNQTNTAAGTVVRANTTSYVSTHRGQSNSQTPAAMCGTTTTSSVLTYSLRPKFLLGFDNRCETPLEEVVANIYPVPVIDLGPDVNVCVDQGTSYVLDAGVQPNASQYLWDNNSTSQVRAVSETGSYSVMVTNQYACSDTDQINVILRLNPDISLGNDTSVCNGVNLPLDPGPDGVQYFWNTGQTGQVIVVSSPGSYSVFVTNSEGCVAADTIFVDMQGELPTIQGIQTSNDGQYTFHFTAINPQNVIGYDWDFGDGSVHSNLAAPTHTYDSIGNYTVVLRLSSTCGFMNDSLSAHIVGIHQINVSDKELTVYPNPTNNIATISIAGDLKMERVEVYSVTGQMVYKEGADSKTKHSLSLGSFASGMYTIQIYTDKGTVSRKLAVVK